MKAVSVILALFAAAAIAAPAPNALPRDVDVSKLERSVCGPSCACQNGLCYCDSCYVESCSWYPDGQTC